MNQLDRPLSPLRTEGLHRSLASRLFWLSFTSCLAIATFAGQAHAQTTPAQQTSGEPTRLAVFQTARDDAALRELAQALDPVLLSALNRFPMLRIGSRPALDLPAMQLTIDCVGESAECLNAVAKQSTVDGLVAPFLRRAGNETVVTLLYFDARQQGTVKAATRRYAGESFEAQLFDDVPSMLSELLGVEPVADDKTNGPHADTAASPTQRRSTRARVPVVPIVITSVGAALIAGGIAFGLSAKATEDHYGKLPVTDRAQANAAADKLDAAQTQATLANIGFVAGGVAVAAGVTLWIVHATTTDPAKPNARPKAWLAPSLLPGHAGLTLFGEWSAGSM